MLVSSHFLGRPTLPQGQRMLASSEEYCHWNQRECWLITKDTSWADYRISHPLALSSCLLSSNLEVTSLEGTRQSTDPWDYFVCQWLQLQKIVTDILRMPSNTIQYRPQALESFGLISRRVTFHLISLPCLPWLWTLCFCPNANLIQGLKTNDTSLWNIIHHHTQPLWSIKREVPLNIADTYVIHPVNTEYNSYCSQKHNIGHLFRATIDL